MLETDKPFSAACERNTEPLYEVLNQIITPVHKRLLEVGSGTGQHASYLAHRFQFLRWTCSDLKTKHSGIQQWIANSSLNNIDGPVEYEAGRSGFPKGDFDILFSANCLHIMPWSDCLALFKDLQFHMKLDTWVIFYGPFNYKGNYTSKSNAEFDDWLKQRNPLSGIRDFEKVVTEMATASFELYKDFEMPANNRTLVFKS